VKAKDLALYMQMLANDVDSIKHIVRGIQWRQDAVLKHLNIQIQPDVLEEIVNPSHTFINEIVRKVRGEFAGDKSVPRRKPKRSQKRRRVIPKRDFRRKKK
jgi:hypothetical protein